MAFSAKTIRTQLAVWQPLLENCSLKTIRKGQNKIGELMEAKFRRQVVIKEHPFEKFSGAWVIPGDLVRQGVVLYLHGGGYTCGGLEYATGFGAMLAVKSGTRTFCAAYRLAPEHRYPAALEDALEAYEYLLSKGYEKITLCGESAGGGLCYALCRKLLTLGRPMPCGIIGLSPWTDMTASGSSYDENREKDPSMTVERLRFFADCYTDDKSDPMVSPLFAELSGMPPSLLLAGGDEIMLSDTVSLHEKLLSSGAKSQLIVTPERWHAYLLYGLEEDRKDFDQINHFLDQVMEDPYKLRWMPLDNAAKIYPAARRQNWSNVFRLSVTLTEKVDHRVLQEALDVTVRRFPSIAARLRKGAFWYYVQELEHAPRIRQESSYPLTRMTNEEMRRCAFRVVVYDRRIAVELFHSLTDGNGAMIFIKSLTAEYLQQKYGVRIPAEKGVLGRLEPPSEEELEDSFPKYAAPISASRKENTAWHLSGTPEKDGFLHVTCLELSSRAVLEKAHEYGVSVTAFLGAVMLDALQKLQAQMVPEQKHRKPVKVLLPVNLRRLFPSRTLRNFALYTSPELLTRLGEYSFPEICRIVHHHMGAEITPKQMGMKIATNVNSEKLMAVRILPLFIKNAVMKAIFNSVGEKKTCLCLSNLGAVELPEAMMPYVERMDFVLGVQAMSPYNCGALSFKDTLYINFIRNIREPALESHFYRCLRELGLAVEVRSNRSER